MMAIVFIGLNILDAYLAKTGLAMGAIELNPIARVFDVSMLWKGLIAGAIVAGLYYWGKEKLLLPLCLGMFGVCLWNFLVCFILKGGEM